MNKHPDFDLLELRDKIEEHFTASHWTDVAILADCEDIINNHSRLLRSLDWCDDDYRGNVLDVLRQIRECSTTKIDIIRQYLANQFGIVVGEFVSNVAQDRHIVFSPSVFQVPAVAREQDLVAVMMPFGAEFDGVLKSIRSACKSAHFRCVRADDVWEESTIVQEVFNLIFKSHAVIVDFSGKNPNVMYEAGIAHTLGRTVIPITQHLDDIPFDLKHHRALKYLSNQQGLDTLSQKLQVKLSQI